MTLDQLLKEFDEKFIGSNLETVSSKKGEGMKSYLSETFWKEARKSMFEDIIGAVDKDKLEKLMDEVGITSEEEK